MRECVSIQFFLFILISLKLWGGEKKPRKLDNSYCLFFFMLPFLCDFAALILPRNDPELRKNLLSVILFDSVLFKLAIWWGQLSWSRANGASTGCEMAAFGAAPCHCFRFFCCLFLWVFLEHSKGGYVIWLMFVACGGEKLILGIYEKLIRIQFSAWKKPKQTKKPVAATKPTQLIFLRTACLCFF